MADELMNMVDEHLAWQSAIELQRRASVGTLIVDWDGVGEMRVHRRDDDSKASSPTPQPQPRHEHLQAQERACTVRAQDFQSGTAERLSSRALRAQSGSSSRSTASSTQAPSRHDSLVSTHHHTHLLRPRPLSTSVHFHRSSASLAIQVHSTPCTNTAAGLDFDPATNFTYDYTGRVIHVNRSDGCVGEYWHVPVDTHESAGVPIKVVETFEKGKGKRRQSEKRLAALPIEAELRTAKVLGLVKNLFAKLDRMGVLGRMRQERERARRTESWVDEGYVT
jgi:hypothetical protein